MCVCVCVCVCVVFGGGTIDFHVRFLTPQSHLPPFIPSSFFFGPPPPPPKKNKQTNKQQQNNNKQPNENKISYLYRGSHDPVYLNGSVLNVRNLFDHFGAVTHFNYTTPSAHCWPLDNGYGTPCGKGVIENCHYDGPGACLTHIYGPQPLQPPTAADPAGLTTFDQRPFFSSDNNGTRDYNETTPRATGLAPQGYIYVPRACRRPEKKFRTNSTSNSTTTNTSSCRLHLSLHGCKVDDYYDDAVHHLGLQEWGEANNIVIVFPRVQNHGGTTETQMGCYDSYGQTGRDFAWQSGVQMRMLRDMIRTVTGF